VRLQSQAGKSFLTRDEYYSMKPDQRGAYWTFSDDQIVQMASEAAKAEVSARVKKEYSVREAEGWVRKPAASAPPPAPAAGAPPAPRPSPIPSQGTPGAEVPDKSFSLLMGESV